MENDTRPWHLPKVTAFTADVVHVDEPTWQLFVPYFLLQCLMTSHSAYVIRPRSCKVAPGWQNWQASGYTEAPLGKPSDIMYPNFPRSRLNRSSLELHKTRCFPPFIWWYRFTVSAFPFLIRYSSRNTTGLKDVSTVGALTCIRQCIQTALLPDKMLS